jgi:hypothetical protein
LFSSNFRFQKHFKCPESHLYNNLAKLLCTVCAFPCSFQTSGPRLHNFSPADRTGRALYYMRKSLGIIFFWIFFRENAERSGATSEYLKKAQNQCFEPRLTCTFRPFEFSRKKVNKSCGALFPNGCILL